jgi:hypothetical protein
VVEVLGAVGRERGQRKYRGLIRASLASYVMLLAEVHLNLVGRLDRVLQLVNVI